MSGTKPTNPKDAIGSTKVPLHLVSPVVKAYQAVAHFLGNIKYGAWNYRAMGARASVYYSAANRHLDKWYEGEELDPADGTPHLANALACINILIECSEGGNLQDDRPPSRDLNPLYARIEKMQAALVAKYGDRRPRHFTIADSDLRDADDEAVLRHALVEERRGVVDRAILDQRPEWAGEHTGNRNPPPAPRR